MEAFLNAEDLAALEEKYVAMQALWADRVALQADGETAFSNAASAERRAAMRLLATRFPGALREFHRSSPTLVSQRLAEVRALRAASPHTQRELLQGALTWVWVVHLHHAAWRDLLAQKGLQDRGTQALERTHVASGLAVERVLELLDPRRGRQT